MRCAEQWRRPACFESQVQFNEWKEQAKLVSNGDRNNFCQDCLPDFKRVQVKEGKCMHPTVWFSVQADGSIEGRRGPPRKVALAA